MLRKPIVLTSLLLISAISPAYSGGALGHSGKSANHSSQAIAHGSIAGVKTVSAVIAVPFIVVGQVGDISQQIGESLYTTAKTDLKMNKAPSVSLHSPDRILNDESSD